MKQEDKELLLVDLYVRLPYGVKIQAKEWATVDTELKIGHIQRLQYDEIEVKPYLRPMSSMTEEEIVEFNNIPSTKNYQIVREDLPWDVANYKQIDWLNTHHFDYRGLIERGLALEAPDGMYKIKER